MRVTSMYMTPGVYTRDIDISMYYNKTNIYWRKVFLWKPARVSGKWRWLIFANEKLEKNYYIINADMETKDKTWGYYNNQDMFLDALKEGSTDHFTIDDIINQIKQDIDAYTTKPV